MGLPTRDHIEWSVFVATRSSDVIGIVECRQTDEALQLRGLSVDPAHCRTGVARAIVDFLSALAQKLGKKWLSLNTIAETGNVAIFERLGFQILSIAPTADFESDTYSELREVNMVRLVN